MQTDHDFTLPRGFVDGDGVVHRDGVMRLATARDEVEPLRDPDVRRNQAYLSVLLLARTVVRLGPLDADDVTPDVISDLFAADFDHLQRTYERLNSAGDAVGCIACPDCAHSFEVDIAELLDPPAGK